MSPRILALVVLMMADTAADSSARAAGTAAHPTPPCEACHGAHGEGMAAAHVPRIAGQSADYLRKQLDDYASGARNNPVMANFAKALNEAQRLRIAARYAAMSAQASTPPTTQAREDLLARGHQLAYQGDEVRRVQSCNSCHGPDGVGVAHAAPYLAGQSQEYLASALKSFHDGTRRNDGGELMRSVAARLDDTDIEAVSHYFASLQF